MSARVLMLLGFAPLLSAAPAFAWGASSSAATPPSPAAPVAEPAAPPAQSPTPEPTTATPAPGPAPVPPSEPPAVTLEEDTTDAPPAPSRFVSPRPATKRRAKSPAAEHPAPQAASPSERPPNDRPRRKRRPPREVWFGWQTLLSDGVSIGLIASQDEDASALGLGGYLFVPPIIHFAHKNVAMGFADFGLRLMMPLGGALVGALASTCFAEPAGAKCPSEGASAGILLGVGGAITLDAAVLAFAEKRPRRSNAGELRWAPAIAAGRDGTRVGLAGSF